jgi:hypothetical protein
MERSEHVDDLIGFAAVTIQNDDVIVSDHAKIAVDCLGGMQKSRWSAGGAQRSCGFAGDMAALADSAGHDPARAGMNPFDSSFNRLWRFGAQCQNGFSL